MRFHRRGELPDRVTNQLREWQSALDAEVAAELSKATPVRRSEGAIADQHWTTHRDTKAFEVIETVLGAMASPNVRRCMYCEHDRGSQIDHARPKNVNSSRTFEWENHVWACGKCNNDKLARYHPDMVIPTVDDPLKHLELGADGRWRPYNEDSRGKATIDTLPTLRDRLLEGPRQQWRSRLLEDLAALAKSTAPSSGDMERFHETATQFPFSDVFAALLAQSRLPNADAFIAPAVVRFIETHPELHRWLPDADEQRLRDAGPKVTELTKAMRPRSKTPTKA